MGKGACCQAHILPQCALLVVLEMKVNQLIIHVLFHMCGNQNLRGHQESYTQLRMELEVFLLSSIPGMRVVEGKI